MSNLYNTVLKSYRSGFEQLPSRTQFHFASRLYLWDQHPEAEKWLTTLKLEFTHNGKPLQVLENLKREPAPSLNWSKKLRQPFFDQYPDLHSSIRVLFRTLFLKTVYGLDVREYIDQIYPADVLIKQRDGLLANPKALASLSSFAINFLFILERFIREDET